MTNFSKDDFYIDEGERIAHIAILKYEKSQWVEVEEIENYSLIKKLKNHRKGGFGSTGK